MVISRLACGSTTCRSPEPFGSVSHNPRLRTKAILPVGDQERDVASDLNISWLVGLSAGRTHVSPSRVNVTRLLSGVHAGNDSFSVVCVTRSWEFDCMSRSQRSPELMTA